MLELKLSNEIRKDILKNNLKTTKLIKYLINAYNFHTDKEINETALKDLYLCNDEIYKNKADKIYISAAEIDNINNTIHLRLDVDTSFLQVQSACKSHNRIFDVFSINDKYYIGRSKNYYQPFYNNINKDLKYIGNNVKIYHLLTSHYSKENLYKLFTQDEIIQAMEIIAIDML